jgi:hypothetical protein
VTVTVDQIQAEFPEFANTDSGLIGYRLADAMQLVEQSTYGDHYDEAVKWLTCHLIALAPHGEPARLVESQEPGGASTTYERHFLRIQRSVVAPQMVV